MTIEQTPQTQNADVLMTPPPHEEVLTMPPGAETLLVDRHHIDHNRTPSNPEQRKHLILARNVHELGIALTGRGIVERDIDDGVVLMKGPDEESRMTSSLWISDLGATTTLTSSATTLKAYVEKVGEEGAFVPISGVPASHLLGIAQLQSEMDKSKPGGGGPREGKPARQKAAWGIGALFRPKHEPRLGDLR